MGLVSFQPGTLHTFVQSAAELKCPSWTPTPAQGSTQQSQAKLILYLEAQKFNQPHLHVRMKGAPKNK